MNENTMPFPNIHLGNLANTFSDGQNLLGETLSDLEFNYNV